MRTDNSCGFEEFRCDVEDKGICTKVNYYSSLIFSLDDETLDETRLHVRWLNDLLILSDNLTTNKGSKG